METSQDPDRPNAKKLRKPSVYFGIACTLLILLALTWSIDESFIYLLLGASSYFFFLGFQSLAKEGSVSREKYNPYKDYQREQRTARSSFWSSLFAQKTSGSSSAKTFVPSPSPADRKLIVGVLIFIASIFGFIVMAVLFGSGDSTSGSEYFRRAEQYYGDGTYDSAYINYRRALQQDPEQADALVGYGNALSALGQPDSAIILYDQALAVNPDLDIARYNKAWVNYQRKNYAQSVAELKTLLEKNPSYFDAMQLLGDVYYEQKVYEEALRWYEDAYTNGLRSRWLCHVMAYLYDSKGQTEKSITFYQEALAYDSTVTEIYKRLGELIPGEDGKYYRDRSGN